MRQVDPSTGPNRPHIPSFSSMSKSTETKTTRHAAISNGVPARLISNNRNQTSSYKPAPAAADRRFRFGETASTATHQNPQEENSPRNAIFRRALILLTFGRIDVARLRKSYQHRNDQPVDNPSPTENLRRESEVVATVRRLDPPPRQNRPHPERARNRRNPSRGVICRE